jgi:phosphotransferase system enzyme I (PtsI)
MAGDITLTMILLGLGLDELSTSPIIVPEVKRIIRAIKYEDARKVAEEALSLPTGKEVEALAKAKLKAAIPHIALELLE